LCKYNLNIFIMTLFYMNNDKLLISLSGAFIGGYKGYTLAMKQKKIRWGKYADNFYPNLIQIGLFSGLGFGIGYCISKLF